jgi:hypothetical protein
MVRLYKQIFDGRWVGDTRGHYCANCLVAEGAVDMGNLCVSRRRLITDGERESIKAQ